MLIWPLCRYLVSTYAIVVTSGLTTKMCNPSMRLMHIYSGHHAWSRYHSGRRDTLHLEWQSHSDETVVPIQSICDFSQSDTEHCISMDNLPPCKLLLSVRLTILMAILWPSCQPSVSSGIVVYVSIAHKTIHSCQLIQHCFTAFDLTTSFVIAGMLSTIVGRWRR